MANRKKCVSNASIRRQTAPHSETEIFEKAGPPRIYNPLTVGLDLDGAVELQSSDTLHESSVRRLLKSGPVLVCVCGSAEAVGAVWFCRIMG